MSIYFDMRQIEDIKKALYESIKSKGIDIQPEEWFDAIGYTYLDPELKLS